MSAKKPPRTSRRPQKPQRHKKTDLLPCPFCGDDEPAKFEAYGSLRGATEFVRCMNCEAEVPLCFWNKRPPIEFASQEKEKR